MASSVETMVYPTTLGERIRDIRQRRGLTQVELAGDDFSKSYVSAVERGKITPSLEALQILAERLDVPISYFLEPEVQETLVREEARAMILEAAAQIDGGQPEQAIGILRRLPTESLTEEELAPLRYRLGQAYIRLNQPTEALVELEAALRYARFIEDAELVERIRNLIGLAHYQQGHYAQAVEHHRLCLKAINDGIIRDPVFKLGIYSNLGNEYSRLSDHQQAIGFYREALAFAQDVVAPDRLAAIYWGLSQSYRELGDLRRAKLCAYKSLTLYESIQSSRLAAQIRTMYAMILAELGELDEAERCYREALDIARTVGDAVGQTAALANLAELHLRQGRHDEAQAAIREALTLATASGNRVIEGQVFLTQASLYAALGEQVEADQQFQAAIATLEQYEAKELLGKAYFRYGQALVSWGQAAEGAKYLGRAYLITGKHG